MDPGLVINESPPEEPMYKVGDLVLGKVKGYPFWPAEITNVSDTVQDVYTIKFFPVSQQNQPEFAIVRLNELKAFDQEQRDRLAKAKKPKMTRTLAIKWDRAVTQIFEIFAAGSNGNGIPNATEPTTGNETSNGENVPASVAAQQKNPKTPSRKRRISVAQDDEKPVEPSPMDSKMKRKKTDSVPGSSSATTTRATRASRRHTIEAEADEKRGELDESVDTSLYTTAVDSSVLDSSVAEDPADAEMTTPRARSNRRKSLPRKFMDSSMTVDEPVSVPVSHPLSTEPAKIEIPESNGESVVEQDDPDQVNGEIAESTGDASELGSSATDTDSTLEPPKRPASVAQPGRKVSQARGKSRQKAASAGQNGKPTSKPNEKEDLDISVVEVPPKETTGVENGEEVVPEKVVSAPTSTATSPVSGKPNGSSLIGEADMSVSNTAEAVDDAGITRTVAEEIPTHLPKEIPETVLETNTANQPENTENDTMNVEPNAIELVPVSTPTQDKVNAISANFLDIAKAQVLVTAPPPIARGRRHLKETPATDLNTEPIPVEELQPEKSPSEPGLSLSMESPPGPGSEPSGQVDLDAATPKESDPPSVTPVPAEAPAAVRNRRNTSVPLRLQDTVNPVTKTAYSLSAAIKNSKKDLNLSHDGQTFGASSKRELNGKDADEQITTDEKRMKMHEDSRDILDACVNLIDATSLDNHDFDEALEMIGVLTDKAKITKEILKAYPVIVQILTKVQHFSGNSALKLPRKMKTEMPQKTADIRRAARDALNTFKEIMAANTKPPAVLLLEQMMAARTQQD